MKLKTLVYLSLLIFITWLALAAQAQAFSVIYSFKGGAFDGTSPMSGVTIKGGVLYGVTVGGGISCGGNRTCGTVYQLTHAGAEWVESPIVRFPSSNGGMMPVARVRFGPDGHLFGTTNGSWSGFGSVYRLTPPFSICKTTACLLWAATDIHTFSGSDGISPGYGDLIWDQAGNIYGTTGDIDNGCGTVFKMTGSGDNWTETPIYVFTGLHHDGCYPQDGIAMDSNGNLFGTNSHLGDDFYGTVWELTYDPRAGWTEATLYTFTGGSDGGAPYAGLLIDSSGNLYGATTSGSQGPAIFELSPTGTKWTFKVLANIPGCSQGPFVSLTMDATDNLYGTGYTCGANNLGNIFKLTNTRNGWVYTSLHDFTGGDDGEYPISSVSIDTDGTLYGVASGGGSSDNGVVWMIKP